MLYLIDANNLAGQMDLLTREDFQNYLKEIIKNYNHGRRGQYYLVFDSLEPMGEKYQDGEVMMIFSPRDAHYISADIKIIELAEELGKKYNQLTLISSDREIIQAVEKIKEKNGFDIFWESSELFVERLNSADESKEKKVNSKEKISKQKKEKINKELLSLWGQD